MNYKSNSRKAYEGSIGHNSQMKSHIKSESGYGSDPKEGVMKKFCLVVSFLSIMFCHASLGNAIRSETGKIKGTVQCDTGGPVAVRLSPL
jgi:hypothetical protein